MRTLWVSAALATALTSAGCASAAPQPSTPTPVVEHEASRDEAEPASLAADLANPAKRTAAIKRVIQFHEDAITKDGGDRAGPTVKPLVEEIVGPMNEVCLDRSLDSRVRSAVVKLLSEVRDPRSAACFARTLESYEPGATEADVQNVMRAIASMKDKSLAPSVMKVFSSMEFASPEVKLIGRDVAEAVLAVVGPADENALVSLLEAPVDSKDQASVHNQAFWQTVAARALGKLKSEKAVRPLVKVILSPEKATVANTALIALINIGKASVGPAEALLQGTDAELVEYGLKAGDKRAYLSAAAQIIGAVGLERSATGLLAAMDKADDATKASIALTLPMVSRSRATIAAYAKVADAAKLDQELPGVGSVKELLSDGASDFFDASLVPWLTKSAMNLKGDAGDVASVRGYALLSAMKTAKADQIPLVERLYAARAPGVDGSGNSSETTVGKPFEKEWAQSKALLGRCKEDVDCYFTALTAADSQTREGQFVGIKAAYMIGILGNEKSRAGLVAAMPKITSGAFRFSALKALQALAPQGDRDAADKLEAFVREAAASNDQTRVQDSAIFPQVVARLRARAE